MDIEIDRIAHADPPSEQSPSHRARLVVPPQDFARASPFLLLAEDWFSPPAGFPDHPHRGIQTVTIVLEGELEHRDHTGARGALGEGDIQWMTAGRGVVHSEMPGERGVHSLQLWLNLPAAQKMAQATYRDQRAAETPARRGPGYEVRVYAGRHEGLEHGVVAHRVHREVAPIGGCCIDDQPGRMRLEVGIQERPDVWCCVPVVRRKRRAAREAAKEAWKSP